MNWKTLVFVLGCIGAVVYGLTAPPAESFANPDMARILFFHLPCAFVTTGLIVHSAWLGMRFLQTRDHGFDARNAAATELALLFAALTMASGIVFSRVQWGAWWQNDPRQTSFLMVLLLCGAGVAIRGGLADEQKTAKATAAYSVATVLPMLFLIFVLPRILFSFHPSDTLIRGELDGAYWFGVLYGLVLLIWAARYLYVKRYEKRLLPDDGDSDGAVVRPVPVSQESDERET